jgi:hypothetical protein
MTPHYYKMKHEKIKQLQNLDSYSLIIDVKITSYKIK